MTRVIECRNCGARSYNAGHGLCPACKTYLRKYGRRRPYVGDGRRERYDGPTCPTCRGTGRLTLGALNGTEPEAAS